MLKTKRDKSFIEKGSIILFYLSHSMRTSIIIILFLSYIKYLHKIINCNRKRINNIFSEDI